MAFFICVAPLIIALAIIAASLPRIARTGECLACGYDCSGQPLGAPCSECGVADGDPRVEWRSATLGATCVRAWTPTMVCATVTFAVLWARGEPSLEWSVLAGIVCTWPMAATVYAGRVRLTEPLHRRWAWTWSIVGLIASLAPLVYLAFTPAGMVNQYRSVQLGAISYGAIAMALSSVLTLGAAIDLRLTQRRAPAVRSWPPAARRAVGAGLPDGGHGPHS